MNNELNPAILYSHLADWWPILSRPEDYAEEAEFFRSTIISASDIKIQTVLELGCGGGNNASHLKKHFRMTLTDISPEMLEVSQRQNPECEHFLGDMRDLRLESTFDAVFIHDAICYMTTEDDLRKAFDTAFMHCRSGGVALFAPDCVKENFRAFTSHGGHDGDNRALRYLSWTWDPDPNDDTYICDMAYLLRDESGQARVVHDRHVMGLFSEKTWLRLLSEAGFTTHVVPHEHSEGEYPATPVFVGKKQG